MGKYTAIDDPSAYFQTAIYTGNGGSDRAIVNDGNSAMQPDWVWYKSRSNATSHITYDSSRGDGPYLKPSDTGDEGTDANMFESFDSDGFSLNGDTDGNGSGRTYVAWQWKANGGTTASNSSGSVTSTTQVNSDAGFSIVTFESASSGNFSVGHGLGVQPAMIITKNREGTSQWYTWHQHLTGGTGNTSYLLSLNRTDAQESYSNAWGAGVTSSVFGMQSGNTATASNDYVAYAFAEKQGYSKFGKYVGNGDANGAFVYTGFKPAFVIIKRSDTSNNWLIYDHKRSGYNPKQDKLYPDDASAEDASTTSVDLLSNGFKLRASSASQNASGGTYIYMAFAENPFVTSTGIMGTAR
jgi:hypothetical protein